MMSNTTECSNILLVCVGLDSDKSAVRKLDVNDLYALFRPFGSLSKVIIFSKKVLLKAFLEFRSIDSASRAREQLHDCFINDYGRSRLYFSALQELSFSNKYLEYKEYAMSDQELPPERINRSRFEKKQKTEKTKKMGKTSNSGKTKNQGSSAGSKGSPVESCESRLSEDKLITIFNDTLMTSYQPCNPSIMESHVDSSVDNENSCNMSFTQQNTPQSLVKTISFEQYSGPRTSLFHPEMAAQTRKGLTELSRPQFFNSTQSTKHNIAPRNDNLVLSKGSQFNSEHRSSATVKRDSVRETEEGSVMTGTTTSNAPSKVILISNLDDCFFTAKELFNVFSCFGNIFKTLLMKNLRKALVEYTSPDFAQNAISFMNNRMLGKSRIKVNFSKYHKIDLKKNNKSENSQQFNEVMIVSQTMHRFSETGPLTVVAPSDTLLLTCDRVDNIKPIDIYLQVQNIAKPQCTKVLNGDKENDDAKAYRVLFKFANTQDALRVLSKCHNSDVKGLPIKVAFSLAKSN